LQELRKRLEEHHGNCAQALTEKDTADVASSGTVNPDTPNVLQVLLKLEQTKARAKTDLLSKSSGRQYRLTFVYASA
jgi:hypothetical protein